MSKSTPGIGIANGNATIATSYTATACGLDYVQSSLQLNQRAFVSTTPAIGVPQPATFTVSGIPPCATVLRAFLYLGTVGSPTTAITASLTNPVFTASVFPMTMIGFDASVCWETDATVAYRADVTALVSGNGNYTISGIPTSTALGADDPEGATLFIIYQDPTQNYTGSIVLADGMLSSVGQNSQPGNMVQFSYTGFNVCGPVSLTRNFMLVCDLQQLLGTEVGLNSAVSNYTIPTAAQLPWMHVSQAGAPAVAGQTLANFYVNNQGADCYGVAMTGMYYRTGCMNCQPAQPNPTLTVVVASDLLCPASVSATATGGSGNYSYSWSGSAQTGSLATGLTPGVYTVTVYDKLTCATGSATIFIAPTASLNLTASPDPLCPTTVSVSVTGGAGAYTYSWTGTGNGLNTAQATALSPGLHTVTAVNACSMGSTTVLVTPGVLSLTASPNPLCPTTVSVSVTGGAGPYTYSWTGTGNGLNAAQATVLSPGLHTVTAVNACSMGSTTVLVTPGVLSLNLSSTPACPVAAATVVASGFSGPYVYNWLGTAQTGSVATNLSTNNYTVTVQTLSGCAMSTSAVAVAVPVPTMNISQPPAMCVGSVAVISMSPAMSSFTWSPQYLVSIAFNANGAQATVNPPVTTNFTVNYMDAIGCRGSKTVQVVVVPTQTFSVSNATLCEGKSFTLNPGVTGIAALWNGPNGFIASNPSFTLANTSPSMSGIYSTTITTAGGCVQLSTFSLTVLAAPLPTISSNSPLCAGTTVSLASLSSNGSFSWAGPAGFASALQNPFIFNPTVSASGNYSCVITYPNGCARSAVLSVTVMPVPQVAIFGNNPVCENATIYFVGSGGWPYQWAGPNSFSSNLVNPVIPNVAMTAAGDYTLSVSNGSCTGFAVTSVTVLPAPVINPPASRTVCESDMLLLSSGATGAASWLWTGPNSYTSSMQNPAITPVQLVNAGNYYLTATGANGCQTTSFTAVTVLSAPLVSAAGTVVCYGMPVTLSATGAAIYNWFAPSGSFISGGPSIFIPVADSGSAGAYTLTGVAANSCSISVVVNVSVLPLPVLSASGATVCEGQNAGLNASGAVAYSWSGPSGFSSAAPGVSFSSVTLQSAGIYTVIGTAANTCTASAVASLSVVPVPQLSVSATPSLICLGESTTLTATGAQTYSWLPLGSSTGPTLAVSPSGIAVFSVLGSNMNLCSSQANLVVRVEACTGLRDERSENLPVVIYPNPTSRSFVVKTEKDLVLQLFNNLGQLLRILELNSENVHTIEVSDLAGGIYYLVSPDHNFRQKVLVTQ